MPTIEEFLKTEERNMSSLEKTFNNRPTISTTRSLAAGLPQASYPGETIIHRSAIGKIAAVVLSLFICWTIGVLAMIQHDLNLPYPVRILILLILVSLIVLVIWYTFLNPKYKYDIKLTKEYVQVGDRTVWWKDVTETCIMSKRQGKIINNWLVIFMKDDTVDKLELFRFSVSNSKLAGMVEWYKGV